MRFPLLLRLKIRVPYLFAGPQVNGRFRPGTMPEPFLFRNPNDYGRSPGPVLPTLTQRDPEPVYPQPPGPGLPLKRARMNWCPKRGSCLRAPHEKAGADTKCQFQKRTGFLEPVFPVRQNCRGNLVTARPLPPRRSYRRSGWSRQRHRWWGVPRYSTG